MDLPPIRNRDFWWDSVIDANSSRSPGNSCHPALWKKASFQYIRGGRASERGKLLSCEAGFPARPTKMPIMAGWKACSTSCLTPHSCGQSRDCICNQFNCPVDLSFGVHSARREPQSSFCPVHRNAHRLKHAISLFRPNGKQRLLTPRCPVRSLPGYGLPPNCEKKGSACWGAAFPGVH